MRHRETYNIYTAYVTNVREFIVVEKELRRGLNEALRKNKQTAIKVHTKLYALVYSTFAEANFMKMVLTPHGFDQSAIDQILSEESVKAKWMKCLQMAFQKFSKYSKNSEVPNKIKELIEIVEGYIVDPSVIRNKVAHGQLSVALNRKNTSLNLELTSDIKALDFVTIWRWFDINKRLTQIVEDLIESPQKEHYRSYYQRFQELEDFILKTKLWNSSTKKPKILKEGRGKKSEGKLD